MTPFTRQNLLAVWAITPNGAEIALRLARHLPGCDLCLAAGLARAPLAEVTFQRLAHALPLRFTRYGGHIFVMATGIVVRLIAPLIRHKTLDPAVVVIDEGARHAISLVSGHLGGANQLALEVGRITAADPVITTATDLNAVPAIDLLAKENHLSIENPAAIHYVSMALLTGQPVRLHDPMGWIGGRLPAGAVIAFHAPEVGRTTAGVWVDDVLAPVPPRTLVLRPPSLVAGMGCNRGTPLAEMRGLLLDTLARFRLAPASLNQIASITLKQDEPGLLALAQTLGVPLVFFEKDALARVDGVVSPSAMVAHHIGVESVCEAAAILAAGNGPLIVPKQTTRNATVAIARIPSTSSASVRGDWTTSR
ncbi:MAG: cobalt-precorrin 5A hydrolase [Desulfobacterales bacterium]